MSFDPDLSNDDPQVPPEQKQKAKRIDHNLRRTRQNERKWNQKKFLDALKLKGTDTHAAEDAGISISAVTIWKREDPAFVEKYQEVQNYLTDLLKRSGMVRATVGWDRPIYHAGKLVGHEKAYSDRCWEILLKGRDKSFRGLDDASQAEISRAVDEIVSKVMMAVNKGLPQTCPHCKNLLGLRENVVKELTKLSGTMGTPNS